MQSDQIILDCKCVRILPLLILILVKRLPKEVSKLTVLV
jgi:hypothetical protein